MLKPRTPKMLLAVATALLTASAAAADELVDFGRDVRPILSDACSACHGPDANTREAELRLDTKAGAFAEREGAAIIVPGDPGRSELYRRITAEDEYERMPPPDAGRTLSAAEIDTLKRWIEQGAKWEEHWAFVPPRRPAPPSVEHADRVQNAIDRFVLRRLEDAGLAPSDEADRTTLIRRVTLDLTGLPPTPREVDAFLADGSSDAYEKLVDRLLASPRYGEHMATVWLDAARYADSNGYQQERTRTMWPWRDWVIRAMNADMPFDRFTVAQLAGDRLPEPTRGQLVATGFNRNHMLNGEGGRIAEESRVEYVIDRVETTATVWLGLTMGCARCHDHKFDPVSQKEFYRFYAYFNDVDERGNVDRGGNANPVLPLPTDAQQRQERELSARIESLKAELDQATTPDALAAWEQELRRHAGDGPLPAVAGASQNVADLLERQRQPKSDNALPMPNFAPLVMPKALRIQEQVDGTKAELDRLRKGYLETMVMRDKSEPRETYVLLRGQWDNPDKSEELAPGVPAALPPLPADAPPDRLALARWLVNPNHPLTARVAVNREWQRFFGRGLVHTPEDFGSQGARPSHPELLDWLAVEFARGGWSVKRLHRLIVTSAVYRQASGVRSQGSGVRSQQEPESASGPQPSTLNDSIRKTCCSHAGRGFA